MSGKQYMIANSALLAMLALAGCGDNAAPDTFLGKEITEPAFGVDQSAGVTVREFCDIYQTRCGWEALRGESGYLLRVATHDQMTDTEHKLVWKLSNSPSQKVRITGLAVDGEQVNLFNTYVQAGLVVNQIRANHSK
jgi:hypothetical protein